MRGFNKRHVQVALTAHRCTARPQTVHQRVRRRRTKTCTGGLTNVGSDEKVRSGEESKIAVPAAGNDTAILKNIYGFSPQVVRKSLSPQYPSDHISVLACWRSRSISSFIESGATTKEEIERLRQQASTEIWSEGYCGLRLFLTTWGEKP